MIAVNAFVNEGVVDVGHRYPGPFQFQTKQSVLVAILDTALVEADVLVILTDQRGLYTEDPRKNPDAEFVSEATAGDPALERMAGGAASTLSKGGMITKILAAKRAAGLL